jgi:hypothetical protein
MRYLNSRIRSCLLRANDLGFRAEKSRDRGRGPFQRWCCLAQALAMVMACAPVLAGSPAAACRRRDVVMTR